MATGRITKTSVDGAFASNREAFLWDDKLKGFGLKVTPAGTKSFIYQYRLGGREAKTRRWTIGGLGNPWTPTTARDEAERLAQLVGQGIDPVAADRERRRLAVDLAFDRYSTKFQETCGDDGWGKLVERTLRLHVAPVLADKALPTITRSDVSEVIEQIPARQIALRRNTFAVLRRLFRWAVGRGDLERSPCEGMETPVAARARDRVLSDAELLRVWTAAGDSGKLFGPIVRLLIATGQRRSEVSVLSWVELDQATAMWTLPGIRAKNDEENIIPLNALAVTVLDGIAGGKKWPKRGLVFATSGGKAFAMHFKGKARLDRAVAADGHDEMPHWRLHDLRRTLATGMQRLGVRFEVTEAILNHVSGSRSGVAGVYQRHNWRDEKRTALDAWSSKLQSLIDGAEQPSNVVPITAAAVS